MLTLLRIYHIEFVGEIVENRSVFGVRVMGKTARVYMVLVFQLTVWLLCIGIHKVTVT